jgi:hypothetical protein
LTSIVVSPIWARLLHESRRIVNRPAAQQCQDDLGIRQLVKRARERISGERHEVSVHPGAQLAPPRPDPEELRATAQLASPAPNPEQLGATAQLGSPAPDPEALHATAQLGSPPPDPKDLGATAQLASLPPDPE